MYKICIFISVHFYLIHAVSYELSSEICKSLTGSFGLSIWHMRVEIKENSEYSVSCVFFVMIRVKDKSVLLPEKTSTVWSCLFSVLLRGKHNIFFLSQITSFSLPILSSPNCPQSHLAFYHFLKIPKIISLRQDSFWEALFTVFWSW